MITEPENEQLALALGRDPTETELGIVSILWSERRSYKSSKRWFSEFKTDGDNVVLGLGKGAGIVDLGDDILLGVAMESNNHPTQTNPYVGSALGIAGVISDVIAHGCKPVALLNSLRFGDPKAQKHASALKEAVRGISEFANSVGIPMVGGDTEFDESFGVNCVLNVVCVGTAKADSMVMSRASTPGHQLVLFGALTGKEQLVDDKDESGRRASAVPGNPLAKRIVIDTLEQLVDGKLLGGLEDVGGGGLALAGAKLAARGNTGVELHTDKVPTCDEDMSALEIIASDSQDRMLAVVTPENLEEVLNILTEYNTPHAVIGQVTDEGLYNMYHYGELKASLPAVLLTSGFPEPDRFEECLPERTASMEWMEEPTDQVDMLLSMLASVNIADRKWIYSQFDQHVQANTLVDIGDNSGVIELPGRKRIALTTSCNSFWSHLHPQIGAANSATLALRNIVASGANPIFIADCLNMGNPERPEAYAEFVEAVKGIGRFSHDFSIPVLTGGVSPYNERIIDGGPRRINLTPQVMMAGVLPNSGLPVRRSLCTPWANIFLIGETHRELNGSEFQRIQLGRVQGLPPGYQPDAEKSAMEAVLASHAKGIVRSCNDIGRGGLAIGLMKMALRGDYGFRLDLSDIPGSAIGLTETLYSETSARYLVEVTETNQEEFLRTMESCKVVATELGLTLNEPVANFGSFSVDLKEARKTFVNKIAQMLEK
ncbi:MAG: phosphoribosylformylglycinamidine synthase subunit PurL [Candidatus Thorarchaeota archaeon]|jgi:phosphoribosylformylglycinamidine synthase